MPDIHPNDIGLATFADVGDVTKLKTAAKNVVDALNEIYSGADTGSADFGTQIMVDGEDNIIIGANNIVYGNNNLIIGSNNIIVGDNRTIIADGCTRYNKHIDLYPSSFNVSEGTFEYSYFSDDPMPIKVGDKALVSVFQTWTDAEWTDYIQLSSGIQIAEILEINESSNYIKVGNLGLSSTPPDDLHPLLDWSAVDVFIALVDTYKETGKKGSISFQSGEASASSSVALNTARATSPGSFAANSSSAHASDAAAFNGSIVKGANGFSCNIGECYGENSIALNNGITFSPYSFGSGFRSYVLGRPLKCTELDTINRKLTIEEGQNITGITGKTIIIRGYNKGNPILMTEAKVSSVSGNVISLTDVSFGAGAYALTLFPEAYAFVVDTSTSYALSSQAGGRYSIASDKYTFSYGNNVLAAAEGSVIFGKYGNLSDAYALALANGNSLKESGLAFKVLPDGSVHSDAEYSTPCADYAEFFEWEDGNPNAEDRVGYFVKLKDDKITFCEDFDTPIGIVSATPAIIGDSGELHWKDKFVTDEFGRIQYHNVLVPAQKDEEENIIVEEHWEYQPMINPDWNSSKTYIPRKERSEWAPVGVLGKLIVYDDGTLKPGDICRPGSGGIAVKSIENGYNVLKRISDDKVMIWFKG